MKDTELQRQLGRISQRLGDLETGKPAASHTSEDRLTYWGRILGIVVSTIVILGALYGMLHYVVSSSIREELETPRTAERVNSQIDAKLSKSLDQLRTLSEKVAELGGKLAVLDPLVEKMIGERLKKDASLPPAQFAAEIPELGRLLDTAKKQRVVLPQQIVSRVGKRLVETAGRRPEVADIAWRIATEFFNYHSSLNSYSSLKRRIANTGTAQAGMDFQGPSSSGTSFGQHRQEVSYALPFWTPETKGVLRFNFPSNPAKPPTVHATLNQILPAPNIPSRLLKKPKNVVDNISQCDISAS